MSPDKLVRMANQIATFFASQPGDRAQAVADHLSDFWEPRMRAQLLEHIASGGTGLDAVVLEAAKRMNAPA